MVVIKREVQPAHLSEITPLECASTSRELFEGDGPAVAEAKRVVTSGSIATTAGCKRTVWTGIRAAECGKPRIEGFTVEVRFGTLSLAGCF